MCRPEIRLLVTDLDNTLYDWVTYFAKSFYAMVPIAARILDVDEQRLLDEFKAVHQFYHNSEHPFALLETDSAKRRFGHLSRREQQIQLDEAFHAFNHARKENLELYPGVVEALEVVRNAGVPIVAHTEATVPNALFRLTRLNIIGHFSAVYASAPTGPEHPDPDFVPRYETQVRYLPRDRLKPDPRVLETICGEFQVSPRHLLYVGDSLPRDIGMAKSVGASAALAEYGGKFEPIYWQKLVRITHWTSDDVDRAERAKKLFAHVKADVDLQRFDEILKHFTFVRT